MAAPLSWQRRLPTIASCCVLVLIVLLLRLVPRERPLPAPPRLRAARAPPMLPYHDHFEYLLNSAVCGDGPVRAVVVVHSDPRRSGVRRAIRQSLPATELATLGLRRAFMVADASTKLNDGETTVQQSTIVEENSQHGDLVQGNFHDSYHNLTYKHIMALDWAVTFCPQARHIIKMDDDIVYNVYELLKVLQFTPHTKYLGGNVFPHSPPYRGDSKWHVGLDEWPRSLYPPYVSGWLYIVTQDLARALVLQSTVVPLFWIDDAYVTGMLTEQLSIPIRELNKLYSTSVECVRYTTKQNFSEAGPSSPGAAVFAPNVVVTPTDRDLVALQDFNRLARYCQNRECARRERSEVCGNLL